MSLLGKISRVFHSFHMFSSSPDLSSLRPDHPCVRTFGTTVMKLVKEIRETKEGDATVIEAVYVDHPTDSSQLKFNNGTRCCCLCDLGLDIKYHDVLIISQFLHPTRGTMLHRRITGLCSAQQKLIDRLAYQAGKAGLLKKVFMGSRGTRLIMKKKPGHNLPRHYSDFD